MSTKSNLFELTLIQSNLTLINLSYKSQNKLILILTFTNLTFLNITPFKPNLFELTLIQPNLNLTQAK